MKLLILFIALLSSPLSALTHEEPRRINLFVVGTGKVGETFLKLLREQHEALLGKYDIDIRVVGIANRRGMCFYLNGFPLDSWRDAFDQYNEPMLLPSFIARFTAMHFPNSIFIDCTADQPIVELYPSILESGIAIVTPNKKATSSSLHDFAHLQELALVHRTHFLYDACVGAGLPILHAIDALNQSGDEITRFEAILSGTLSSIFNTFHEEDKSFSEAVLAAEQKGYTEPDPRDDLSGLDVMRKVLIIARTAGIPLEAKHVFIQKILPERCLKADSKESFYEALRSYDGTWDFLKKDLKKQGKKLCYVAIYEKGRASLEVATIEPSHPFFRLQGADNAIVIHSKYYPETPLVIQGPGAGPQVTASKVLANVIQIAQK